MVDLRSFDADILSGEGADEAVAEVAEAVAIDGGVILNNAIGEDVLRNLHEELAPWTDMTPGGRDDFSGRLTKRTGALVARSAACRDLVMDPRIVGLANSFLGPFTNRIQLHLTQVINIGSGQGRQPFHRDRLAWGGYIPREIEPQFNTIWALTDFTAENGATYVVPGSPGWASKREPTEAETARAEMTAGSVLLYSGSVIHGGGDNQTDEARTGINITYTLAWLRTEENQFLSCPPEVARQLDPDLQDMLGYTMGNYALGYYSDPSEINETSDIRPPELVLGRKPKKASSPI